MHRSAVAKEGMTSYRAESSPWRENAPGKICRFPGTIVHDFAALEKHGHELSVGTARGLTYQAACEVYVGEKSCSWPAIPSVPLCKRWEGR